MPPLAPSNPATGMRRVAGGLLLAGSLWLSGLLAFVHAMVSVFR